MARSCGVCVHPSGRYHEQSFACASAQTGRAARISCRPNVDAGSFLRRSVHWFRSAAIGTQGWAVVCAGIHMSDIPASLFHPWKKRELLSVASLTRKDCLDFLRIGRRSDRYEDHDLSTAEGQ